MSQPDPATGWTTALLDRIETSLLRRGFRIQQRLRTPDRVYDWVALDAGGTAWIIRAIWSPPGHLLGMAEFEGFAEALRLLPGWCGWLLVAPGSVSPAGDGGKCPEYEFAVTEIDAIFLGETP